MDRKIDGMRTMTNSNKFHNGTDDVNDSLELDMFFALHGSKFPSETISTIRQKLMELDESSLTSISMINFKIPTTTLFLAWFGFLGLDHFYLGKATGVFKLLTLGGFCFWWFMDLFTAFKRTKKYNYDKFQQFFLKYNRPQQA